LEEIRQALLTLHKAIVDPNASTYEKPWAHPIAQPFPANSLPAIPGLPGCTVSQLIVSMDEALDPKEQLTAPSLMPALKTDPAPVDPI